MTRLRAYLANWLARTDVAELRRQLARSQLECMRLRDELRRSELTVRSYEWHVKPGVRA